MENLEFFTPLYSKSDVCVTDRELNVNTCGITTMDRISKVCKRRDRTLKCYYLLYLTYGELNIIVDGKNSVLQSGSFIIIPPGSRVFHSPRPGTSETVHYFMLFSGTKAKQLLQDLNLPENVVTNISLKDDILRAFNRLFSEFIHIDRYFEISSVALMTSLLTRFARVVNEYSDVSQKGHVLAEALTYINRHYGENISMKKLASSIKLSYGHFGRLFKETMGMSPTKYLNRIRLDKACLLLNRYEISIQEVAVKSGFPDQSYFSRVFTKQFGVSPSKYRASINKNNL